MKLISCVLLLLFLSLPVLGETVKNTSYTTSTGEKVLRLELVIPAGKQEAWKLFTSAEGWRKWATPVVSMDFRIGGQILSHYDKSKSIGDPGTIRLPIINYIEGELITLKVILTDAFDPGVRQEDNDLQEVIQFFDASAGKTRIVSSMIGWGKSPQWDKTYAFFSRGNEWSYNQLAKLFSLGTKSEPGSQTLRLERKRRDERR